MSWITATHARITSAGLAKGRFNVEIAKRSAVLTAWLLHVMAVIALSAQFVRQAKATNLSARLAMFVKRPYVASALHLVQTMDVSSLFAMIAVSNDEAVALVEDFSVTHIAQCALPEIAMQSIVLLVSQMPVQTERKLV